MPVYAWTGAGSLFASSGVQTNTGAWRRPESETQEDGNPGRIQRVSLSYTRGVSHMCCKHFKLFGVIFALILQLQLRRREEIVWGPFAVIPAKEGSKDTGNGEDIL
jgi:hypothetical protein